MKKINRMRLLLVTILVLSFLFTACNAGDVLDKIQGFKHGEWDGNTYTNEKFGLEVNFPDGWYVFTTEEMEQTFGQTLSDLEDTDEELSDGAVMPLFIVTETSDLTIPQANMNLIATRSLVEPDFEAEYDEASVNDLKKQFEAYGEVTIDIIGEVDLGTQKAYCLSIVTSVTGTDVVQHQRLYQVYDGGYMLTFTLTGFNGDQIEDMAGFINYK